MTATDPDAPHAFEPRADDAEWCRHCDHYPTNEHAHPQPIADPPPLRPTRSGAPRSAGRPAAQAQGAPTDGRRL